ncbi:MAG: zf-HC2 domain-containing protein [Ignavibacteriales bacterium]|nr:zf-HC2 domain-containing protein [Ignavibacteriales bacterium]
MNNDEKMICKEFEREVYLYLDNDLSTDRKKYWRQHITSCKTCSSLISDVEIVIKNAHVELTEDLLDAKFDKMVEQAIQKKRFKIAEWLFPQGTAKEKYIFSLKLTVVGVLAAIAVVISLTSNQPNAVKTISNELLDWEGNKITSQINEIKNTMNLIHEDNWDKQIIMLDERMKVLEKESDKFSFN